MGLATTSEDFESARIILLWIFGGFALASLVILVGAIMFFLRLLWDERMNPTNLLILLGVALLSAAPSGVALYFTRSWSASWHGLCLWFMITSAAASPWLFVRFGWGLGRGRLAKGGE